MGERAKGVANVMPQRAHPIFLIAPVAQRQGGRLPAVAVPVNREAAVKQPPPFRPQGYSVFEEAFTRGHAAAASVQA